MLTFWVRANRIVKMHFLAINLDIVRSVWFAFSVCAAQTFCFALFTSFAQLHRFKCYREICLSHLVFPFHLHHFCFTIDSKNQTNKIPYAIWRAPLPHCLVHAIICRGRSFSFDRLKMDDTMALKMYKNSLCFVLTV